MNKNIGTTPYVYHGTVPPLVFLGELPSARNQGKWHSKGFLKHRNETPVSDTHELGINLKKI